MKQYKNYLEFDLIGCDTSFANALRRVVISEVPTMAIETVFVMNNTSVIQDEVLSHRLGLVPIHADARKFDYLPAGGEPTDVNTIVFELHARCSVNPEASKDEQEPKKKFINSSVYSNQFKWIPQGSQEEIFSGDDLIRPCHSDILLAKMRPGQVNMCFYVYSPTTPYSLLFFSLVIFRKLIWKFIVSRESVKNTPNGHQFPVLHTGSSLKSKSSVRFLEMKPKNLPPVSLPVSLKSTRVVKPL